MTKPDYTNKQERIKQLTDRLQQINTQQNNHYQEHQRIDTPTAKLELDLLKHIAQELGEIPRPTDQPTQQEPLNINLNTTTNI